MLSLLEDETIDEEDKPEALKDLLSSLLTSNDAVRLSPSALALAANQPVAGADSL